MSREDGEGQDYFSSCLPIRTSMNKAMANLSISPETDINRRSYMKSTSAENSRKWRERKKQDINFLENERIRKKRERKNMTAEMKDRTREKARLRQQSFRQRHKLNLTAGEKDSDGMTPSQDISYKRRRLRKESGDDYPVKKSQKESKFTLPYDYNEAYGSNLADIHKVQTLSRKTESRSKRLAERFLPPFQKKPSETSNKNKTNKPYILHENADGNMPIVVHAINENGSVLEEKRKTKKQRHTKAKQSSNLLRREQSIVNHRFTGHETVQMEIVETPCISSNDGPRKSDTLFTPDVYSSEDESLTINSALEVDDDSIYCLLEIDQSPLDIMDTTFDTFTETTHYKATDNTTWCKHQIRSNPDYNVPFGDCEIISTSTSSSYEDMDELSYSNEKDPFIWSNSALNNTLQAYKVFSDIPTDQILLELTNDITDNDEITNSSTDSDIDSPTDQPGQHELSNGSYHFKPNCQNKSCSQKIGEVKLNMINNYCKQVQEELKTIKNEANSVRQQVSERKNVLNEKLERWEQLWREFCDKVECENEVQFSKYNTYLHNMMNSQTTPQHVSRPPNRTVLRFKPANISEESLDELFGLVKTLSL